jgi:hypothetical protein
MKLDFQKIIKILCLVGVLSALVLFQSVMRWESSNGEEYPSYFPQIKLPTDSKANIAIYTIYGGAFCGLMVLEYIKLISLNSLERFLSLTALIFLILTALYTNTNIMQENSKVEVHTKIDNTLKSIAVPVNYGMIAVVSADLLYHIVRLFK